MATVAYTSTQADPKVSQVDAVIDLSGGGALGGNVNLFGDAIDSGDPAAIFTWSWSIIYKPPGSAATFSDAAAQNPTFGPIDIWGEYLIKLVATSSGPGGQSQADILEIPETALVAAKVKSTNLGIEQPADYSRDWGAAIRKYAQQLEAMGAGGAGANHNLGDHADVAVATGPLVDQLCDGSYAEDGALAALHVHRGPHVDVATPAERGTVLLENDPVDPNNPKAINWERIRYTGAAEGTIHVAGYAPGIIDTVTAALPTPVWHCIWFVEEAVELVSFQVTLQDGGPLVGAGEDDYEFVLLEGLRANVEANTLVPIAGAAVNARFPAAAHGPLALDSVDFPGVGPWPLAARKYVALACSKAPVSAGRGLNVILNCRRKV